MKCEFCGKEIKENMENCPFCGRYVKSNTFSVKKVCPKCNADVENESRFCNKCGWDFEMSKSLIKYCPNCGIKLADDAKYCPDCGCDLENPIKKKHKRIKWLIAIGIIAIAIIAAGGSVYYLQQKAMYEAEQEALREAERQRCELIKNYKLKAVELNNEINNAQSNFNLLSTMFDTSKDLNTGLLGPSFYISYAESLCSSEINEEKNRKRNVDKLYEELNDLKCKEEEIQELEKAIEDYYYAYSARYELLVEMNFTASTFSSKESSNKSDFSSKGSIVREIINNLDIDTESDNDAGFEGAEIDDDKVGGKTV